MHDSMPLDKHRVFRQSFEAIPVLTETPEPTLCRGSRRHKQGRGKHIRTAEYAFQAFRLNMVPIGS